MNSRRLGEARIRELLQPFGIDLAPRSFEQLEIYLDLLLRWNSRINLTSIRNAEECVIRHFGESLYLSRHESISGRLVDVGSGAGFPGLALKLVFPQIQVTLLEPVGKKRAFLKEVVRSCEMEGVEARSELAEEICAVGREFDVVTSRGLGRLEEAVTAMVPGLGGGARIFFWTTCKRSASLRFRSMAGLAWTGEWPIPLSRERVILHGSRVRFT